jgi:hypothetical protein
VTLTAPGKTRERTDSPKNFLVSSSVHLSELVRAPLPLH